MRYDNWNIKPKATSEQTENLGLSNVISTLLVNRGIYDRNALDEFLNPPLSTVHDPLLLNEMQICLDRLIVAIENRETIGVFGDFDTDGLTGAAVLTHGLQNLGLIVFPYVPHRVDEGHGVSKQSLDYFKNRNVSLIVTVDCGISSSEEILIGKNMGMDTIITDHHTSTNIMPEAVAIVNPSHDSGYPFNHLTGVGTALKVMQGLYHFYDKPLPDVLYAFTALGTLSDVGIMLGENRYFVKKGLEVLRNTKIIGLDALINISNLNKSRLTTQDLSFGVIPRINAAGRIEHAKLSLELLLSENTKEASGLAIRLENLNKQRQKMTEEAMKEARQQVKLDSNGTIPAIIFAGKANWKPGILGLIAGRLAEEFYRPAIVACGTGDIFRASARSIKEFNMIDSFDHCSEYFDRFGGHPMAAGFTINKLKLKSFRQAITLLAEDDLKGLKSGPELGIDSEIMLSWINFDFIQFLKMMEPFGSANSEPIFMSKNVEILDSKTVGVNSDHLKLSLIHEDRIIDAIAFRQGNRIKESKRRPIDIAYKIGVNYWNGRETTSLIVEDFRQTE